MVTFISIFGGIAAFTFIAYLIARGQKG